MRLAIIGASGQGKVVADIAEKNGYDEIAFYDDKDVVSCGKWLVIGSTDKALSESDDMFVAVGDAKARERLMEFFAGHRFPVLVHPSAVIAEDVAIGEGTVVMAGAVVNPGTRIGRGAIVNTCSSVDHDCTVEDFVHISVGAHLCGTVFVGARTWIGAGVTISNNVNICDDCVIGAGAVVVKDINTTGTYVGVLAKKIK